jgi:hypothetical protein
LIWRRVMRLCLRGVLAVWAVGSLALPVFGQLSNATIASRHRAIQPFTAEFKITSERTLANGTTITQESTERQVKDAEGRILTVTITQATEERPERSFYHVYDPVARTNSSWSTPGKRATVDQMPPLPEPGQRQAGCWTTSTDTTSVSNERTDGISAVAGGIGVGGVSTIAPAATRIPTAGTARLGTTNKDFTREDLGTQTIQGVLAKGTRTTRTTPAGAIGNDAPLVRTSETWQAATLGLVVREVTDDPQSGKRSRELVELSQEAPDPASFQPPQDYEIQLHEMHEVPCQR